MHLHSYQRKISDCNYTPYYYPYLIGRNSDGKRKQQPCDGGSDRPIEANWKKETIHQDCRIHSSTTEKAGNYYDKWLSRYSKKMVLNGHLGRKIFGMLGHKTADEITEYMRIGLGLEFHLIEQATSSICLTGSYIAGSVFPTATKPQANQFTLELVNGLQKMWWYHFCYRRYEFK